MMRMAGTTRKTSPALGAAKIMNPNRRRWIWITTAAALMQQQHPAAHAFVMAPTASRLLSTTTTTTTTGSRTTSASWIEAPTTRTTGKTSPSHSHSRSYGSTTKLHMSGGGVLDKIKNAAKSILPKKWFRPEEEKRAEIERKQIQQEIKGGLTELLKDAPLAIRMLGSAIAPLFSSAMSGLAQVAEQQQATMSTVLTQASFCIANDAAVIRSYGSSVQISMQPFSQSSSTSSINGQTSTRIQVATQVVGSLDSGVATITANEIGIQTIQVQSNTSGRIINVGTTTTTTTTRGGGSSGHRLRSNGDNDDDNIIEAEIIEKKVQK